MVLFPSFSLPPFPSPLFLETLKRPLAFLPLRRGTPACQSKVVLLELIDLVLVSLASRFFFSVSRLIALTGFFFKAFQCNASGQRVDAGFAPFQTVWKLLHNDDC